MSDTEKIKAKLIKLFALARQGVGGEKENAKSVLDKLLTKHGLTLEDLDSEQAETIQCEFKFADALERKLLLQVIFTALNVFSIPVRDDHKNELFGPDDKDSGEEKCEPSKLSKEDIEAIAFMAMAMKKTQTNKALPSAIAY